MNKLFIAALFFTMSVGTLFAYGIELDGRTMQCATAGNKAFCYHIQDSKVEYEAIFIYNKDENKPELSEVTKFNADGSINTKTIFSDDGLKVKQKYFCNMVVKESVYRGETLRFTNEGSCLYNKDGNKDGIWYTTYYSKDKDNPGSQKTITATYKNGILDGSYHYYYSDETGADSVMGLYQNDKKVGEWILERRSYIHEAPVTYVKGVALYYSKTIEQYDRDGILISYNTTY